MVNFTLSLVDESTNVELYKTKNITQPFEEKNGYGPAISQAKFLEIKNLLIICKLSYEVEEMESLELAFNSSVSEPADLAANLAKFFTSTNTGDVTLKVQNREFQAHKLILAARSPVFAAMFQHDMKEAALNRVDIVDIEPGIFQAVLRFIYTDQVDLTEGNAEDLLAAANRYNLDLLKWKCEKALFQHLKTKNCCRLLGLADLHGAINLKKAVIKFIKKFSADVLATDDWKEMKKVRPDLVCEVVEDILLA